MNMIEKVARALYPNYANNCPCNRCKRAKTDAILAIAAMREPTEFMKEGALTDPGSGGPDAGYETEVWHNMIDAALKEE